MVDPSYIRAVIVTPNKDLELMPKTADLIHEVFPHVEEIKDEFTGKSAVDRLVSWATEKKPSNLPEINKTFLVITEYKLPDMTCQELMERIKAKQVLANSHTSVYTVVVDSVHDDDRLSRVIKCGGQYVVKPVQSKSLELIREMIELWGL